MSVDQRLRTGLHASAAAIEPATHRALGRVQERARRAERRRRGVTVSLAVAACAAVIAGTVMVTQPGGPPEPPPAVAEGPLVGTYVVDVADSPARRRLQLSGRWVITFDPDGALEINPPAGYDGSTSGASYEVVDRRLRTDALMDLPGCQATADTVTGTYTWVASGAGLAFTVVSDTCEARIDLFTGQPWQRP